MSDQRTIEPPNPHYDYNLGSYQQSGCFIGVLLVT
jgi:hypothetical protein